ncbi:MAG: hypothetical protein Q4G24_01815 [Paracoccus sp. (in: a-proteobacteria)]|uniref:hypothetical protein n=1 Tax=Paracoccus sp. TaxID=267 RepID=UPI0026E0E6C4|nr:hypothetical protein [Paracoccus sp. (in: a-proteobacteria)]MDO5620188.1 hypothetical protein [Paracoccus sp. (in: a-proteobacteria)]
MNDRYDNRPRLTDAAVTSQTRFGPRPAHPNHHVASPYRPSTLDSRRVIPSGDVSPGGDRVWPRPSLTSKLLVWGGMGVAAAALTAGGILAARKVVDALAGEPQRPQSFGSQETARRHAAPQRFLDEAPRPKRRPRPSLLSEVNSTTQQLSGGLNSVIGSLAGAVAGFRAVARDADGIIRDFNQTADSIRAMMQQRDNRRPGDDGNGSA